jgi:hypothetical protein
MAGGRATIKATTCERSDKRTTRACFMSQDITTEHQVRKARSTRDRIIRARVEVRLRALFDQPDHAHLISL